MQNPETRPHRRRRTVVFSSLVLSLGLSAGSLPLAATNPAHAASLKSIMGRMGEATKSAKAVLSAFDAGTAETILQSYVQDARAADAIVAAKGDAAGRDMHIRFGQFLATVEAAKSTVADRASFRTAFAGIAKDCRSCHSLYKD